MSRNTFGTPTTTVASTNVSFGTQKRVTGFGLGSTTFTQPPAASGSLTFSTSTPATSSALATQAQSSGLFLGSSTSTTTTSSLFPVGTTSAVSGTGLTFGTPITSTGLTLGTMANTSATRGLPFGVPATTTPSLGGFSTMGNSFGAKSTTVTTTTTSRGLGGVDISIGKQKLDYDNNCPTTAKENLLPNQLMETIENFKEFVKTQKAFSSDIARGSARPLNRCAEDATLLMEILTTLAGAVQRDRFLTDKLKQDTAKALQNAEIAQRTHDTPPGLQYENNVPLLFFLELAENFEHDLMLFKSQIEATEKHIQTIVTPKTLTPQELTMAMNKLHESLIAVAGRLQGVHAKVQQQKEQYLNIRKYVLKDSTNVFEDVKSSGKTNRISTGKLTSGPSPFGSEKGLLLGRESFLSSTALSSSRPPNYGTSNILVWGSATPIQSASNVSVGSLTKLPMTGLDYPLPFNAPSSVTDSTSSFQLQKPPIGNKRGKH